MAILPAPAFAAPARCYVALLHGSGPDMHDQDPRTSSRLAGYWSPDGSRERSFADAIARGSAPGAGCLVRLVGYDAGVAWWDVRAAGRAARVIVDWIRAEQIPDGALALVGHSMGGLVARYIVNNGVPEAPYYNEHVATDGRMDYDLVRRKTAFLVSIETPHLGAQAADALYGRADHGFTNAAVKVLRLFGYDGRSAGNASMTRATLGAAAGPTGEMADHGRAIPLYTIAGVSPDAPAEVRSRNDRRLALAWALLCARPAFLNLWGLACGQNAGIVDGDGVVERTSAHGIWPTGALSGARAVWLDVAINHEHGRYDDHAVRLRDHLSGVDSVGALGSYLGAALPALFPTAGAR